MRNVTDYISNAFEMLKDEVHEVRIYALQLLKEYNHQHYVVEAVIPVLHDSHPEVRVMAVRVLQWSFDRSAVGPLLVAASDSDPGVRRQVIHWAWLWHDPRFDDALENALKDENYRVRKSALMALGFAGRLKDTKLLLCTLEDSDPGVRSQTAYALRRLCPEIAPAYLIKLLGDKDASVRSAAAPALSDLRAPEALVPLATALKDQDDGVREMTASTLGKYKNKKAAVLLCNAFNRGERNVLLLLELLRRAYEPGIIYALDNYSRFDELEREWILEAVHGLKHRAAEDIFKRALKDPSEYIRLKAEIMLSSKGPDKGLNKMLKGLKLKNQYKFRNFARDLGELGNKEAVPHLTNALKNRRWDARWAVAEALGKLGDKRAVDPLILALRYNHNKIREHAARALGRLGDNRAVAPLIDTLKDEYGNVRAVAVMALGEFHSSSAVKPLIQVLVSDWNIFARRNAATALGKIGDPGALADLKQAAKDEDPGLAGEAAKAVSILVYRGQ